MNVKFVSVGDGISWGNEWGFADELAQRLPLDPDWVFDNLDLAPYQHVPENPLEIQAPILRRIIDPPADQVQEEAAASAALASRLEGADLVTVSMFGHDALASYLAPLGPWPQLTHGLVVRTMGAQSGPPVEVDPQSPTSPLGWNPALSHFWYVDWRSTLEQAGPAVSRSPRDLQVARTDFRADLRFIVQEIAKKAAGPVVLLDLPDPISLWPGNKVDVTWTRHFECMGDIIKSVAENAPAHWDVRHAPIRQTLLDLGLNIADYVSIDGLHINTRGQAFVADRVIETAFS